MTCNNPECFHFPGNIQWFVNSAHMYCTTLEILGRKNVAFYMVEKASCVHMHFGKFVRRT